MSRAISLIVAALVLFLFYGFDIDSKIQQSEERTEKLWTVLENRYQQRNEQLSIVLKVLQHHATKDQLVREQDVLNDVVILQEKALAIRLEPKKVYEKIFFEQFIITQSQLTAAINALSIAIKQSSLSDKKVILSPLAQLEQAQQLVNVAHRYYDQEVDDYNLMVSKFPGHLFAELKGYQRKPTFRGSPKRVDFNQLSAPSSAAK